MAVRLDKYLADAGFGTRKEIKQMIKNGRVVVNNTDRVSPEYKFDPEADRLWVDDDEIMPLKALKYYVLNKPAGVITATRDKLMTTVLDLLPKELRRDLSPVGRLDKDTKGLLILTNDGPLLHRLLSPKSHVDKTYLAGTDIPFTNEDVQAFENGMDIGDDKPTLPAGLQILKTHPETENASLITIKEGRFHQIKRMAEHCGKNIIFLKRISMGGFTLPEDLAEGQWREMTEEEVECLKI